jgi:hypothetical protein
MNAAARVSVRAALAKMAAEAQAVIDAAAPPAATPAFTSAFTPAATPALTHAVTPAFVPASSLPPTALTTPLLSHAVPTGSVMEYPATELGNSIQLHTANTSFCPAAALPAAITEAMCPVVGRGRYQHHHDDDHDHHHHHHHAPPACLVELAEKSAALRALDAVVVVPSVAVVVPLIAAPDTAAEEEQQQQQQRQKKAEAARALLREVEVATHNLDVILASTVTHAADHYYLSTCFPLFGHGYCDALRCDVSGLIQHLVQPINFNLWTRFVYRLRLAQWRDPVSRAIYEACRPVDPTFADTALMIGCAI